MSDECIPDRELIHGPTYWRLRAGEIDRQVTISHYREGDEATRGRPTDSGACGIGHAMTPIDSGCAEYTEALLVAHERRWG